MSDVLSQSQIDVLLKSMREGNDTAQTEEDAAKEKEYKSYDFYSPKKFTKDKLKILKGIYDNYCRIIVSQLNGVLRMSCEIEVISVEEQRYHEFSSALSDNDVMELISLKLPDETKNPPMVFHIGQGIMVNMIDRMLGGSGDDTEIEPNYDYTEIEIALYKRVMGYFAGAIRDAWKNYILLDVENQRLEQTPSMFQEIGLDEPVAIVVLNMKMPKVSGYINICIPGNLLTNLFSVIENRRHIESVYDNGIVNSKDIIMEKLKDSALDMKVELGKAELSFAELYALKVDDVIDLNKQCNSDVKVYVADRPWFEGKLGVYKKNVAVKLSRRVTEEEEEVSVNENLLLQ